MRHDAMARHFVRTWALLFFFLAANGSDAASSSKVFDVRRFGARGDGRTIDTAAIQAALDACGRSSGGTVKFSPGTYLSQPLTLRTKTTVSLAKGATLLASPVQSDFLKAGSDWLAARTNSDFNPFISGKNLTDVAIIGKGTIDGNGANWWGPAEEARIRKPGYVLPRPNLVVLEHCENVHVTGVSLINSPKSHLVPNDCDGVIIDGITVHSPAGAANTDGIDPINCRHVTIEHCTIDTGDDDIAIKSGRRIEGRPFACENIRVTDCIFRHGHGMAIGSETVGGIRHVQVDHCRFEDTDNGLRIKSSRGRGGVVEDISYSHIRMKNVHPAISIVGYYQYSTNDKFPDEDAAQPMTDTTPIFRNITISDLAGSSTHDAGLIVGLPESPVSNVVLQRVRITASTGLTVRNAHGIRFEKSRISVKSGPVIIAPKADAGDLESSTEPQK